MAIRKSISLIFFLLLVLPAFSQSKIVKDFKSVCDSLSVLIQAKTSVKGDLKMKAVMKRGSCIDIYFTQSLGDLPWKYETYQWFKSTLKELFPEEYGSYRLGGIYCERTKMEKLITSELGFSGEPADSPNKIKDRRYETYPLAVNPDKGIFKEGLSGRHIAVWQSHGRFYDQNNGTWRWQRPCLFQTVEDMFTLGFVLPYLVPMLENAGANVILPRERDYQRAEIITDNDAHFNVDYNTHTDLRRFGKYSETGKWENAGEGFADIKPVYDSLQNPFKYGSARMTECIEPSQNSGKVCSATWTPDIPHRGEYAVYVSYKSLPQSTESAHYTVRHMGGESHFFINQKMGGGTWIYLGTFEFDKGTSGNIYLDNITPSCRKHKSGSVVTADAVKVGGGVGNISRKPSANDLFPAETSGLPRYAEGARYWMQWSGCDSEVYSQNDQMNDYRDDFMSRGKWVKELSGGSRFNPKEKGRNIPIDMAFAFHSDAGFSSNDSIIGTLGIYTLLCDKSSKFADGSDRMTGRELTDIIQSQVVRDVRAEFDPLWSRRHIWDRSYSESRTTGVPTMLLEMLSHQNFADMKHGLDPEFRFTVSRAIYKGILKYLSSRYSCEYKVQPLPVNSFSASISSANGKYKTRLSWKDTRDTLEPTAVTESYMLYTRIDGGSFDNGVKIHDIQYTDGHVETEIDINPGHIYSFKIAAINAGGISFPSEILSVGIPEDYGKDGCRNGEKVSDRAVIIVNNFDRVSNPAWFDTPQYAGFDNKLDSGVPYIRDISFIGEMYQTRRDMPYISDENPGFGASYTGYAGKQVAGNTFDYPYIHGKAVMKAGYPFFSASAKAFTTDSTLRKEAWSADIICGKQVTTKKGRGAVPDKFRVFTQEMQNTLSDFASEGGNILVSGANIGTDIWDKVFPVECDSTFRAGSIEFAKKVLGYKWVSNYASQSAEVVPVPACNDIFKSRETEHGFNFHNTVNEVSYSVETPDGIAPASRKAASVFKYADSGISAGISYSPGNYKTICFGFPIETIKNQDIIDAILSSSLKFFSL